MSKQAVRCVAACTGADGPDLVPCIACVTEAGRDDGLHYEMVTAAVLDAGYEGPCVVFDEDDGPGWLFDRFDWAAVPVRDSL